jgi:Domain of unknown function (DUF4404)
MTDAQSHPLKQSLAQLHAELARAPRLDATAKQHLRAALADIERRMQQEGGAAPTADASPHPLEALAVGFEADHPSLAASVRQFIGLLGQAGL